MRNVVVGILSVLALAACDASKSSAPSNVTLTTDSSSYTAIASGGSGVWVRLVVTVHNGADTAVYLGRCTLKSKSPGYAPVLVSPPDSEGSGYVASSACPEVPPFVVA